jgi:glyoxylase I family protein
MKQKRQTQVWIHHVALQTAHFEKAFEFYTKLLGLRVVKEPFNFKGKRTLAWLDAGTITIELYGVKNDRIPQPYDDRRVGADHIAFEVQNLDTVLSHLRKHNVKVLKEPFIPPNDDPQQPHVAFIEGVDGEEIELREIPCQCLEEDLEVKL